MMKWLYPLYNRMHYICTQKVIVKVRFFILKTVCLSAFQSILWFEFYGFRLITGFCLKNDFDVEYYIANCSKTQKDAFVDRMLAYISRMVKK